MQRHAENCEPHECCGLIASDGAGRIRFAYPLTNIDRSPSSFTIDPAGSFGAFRHADSNGWEVSGVFHSHPQGPEVLSELDLAGAQEGWINILIHPHGLKAYRSVSGQARELALEIV